MCAQDCKYKGLCIVEVYAGYYQFQTHTVAILSFHIANACISLSWWSTCYARVHVHPIIGDAESCNSLSSSIHTVQSIYWQCLHVHTWISVNHKTATASLMSTLPRIYLHALPRCHCRCQTVLLVFANYIVNEAYIANTKQWMTIA